MILQLCSAFIPLRVVHHQQRPSPRVFGQLLRPQSSLPWLDIFKVFLCCWTRLGLMNLAACCTQTAWGNWCGRFCDPTSWPAWSYLTLALTFFSTRVLSVFALGILWWVLWYNIVLLNQLIQTQVALPGAAVLVLVGLLPSSSISSPWCLPGRLSDLWIFYIAFHSCLDNHEPASLKLIIVIVSVLCCCKRWYCSSFMADWSDFGVAMLVYPGFDFHRESWFIYSCRPHLLESFRIGCTSRALYGVSSLIDRIWAL